MFQTEINHFFQSFASDGLTTFMVFITSLGYMEFFMLFLIILLLAINFKKAFILFMVLIWTGAITFFFKEYFDLPRPFHVDNTVKLLDGQLHEADGAEAATKEISFDFVKRGATSFWGGLPADVLEATRQGEGVANGFPSGHTSIAIAFWASVALLFRKRWVSIICIALMILVPISRIYLGVHFLADVLGGLSLGALALLVFYWIVLKPEKLTAFLHRDKYAIGLNWISALLLISPFLWMPILEHEIYPLLAFMFGFGLGKCRSSDEPPGTRWWQADGDCRIPAKAGQSGSSRIPAQPLIRTTSRPGNQESIQLTPAAENIASCLLLYLWSVLSL